MSDATEERITTPEEAQRRLDEIWTRTAGVIASGAPGILGGRFLLRSEITDRLKLVDVGNYGNKIERPTHASLERLLWPSLGQAITRDARIGGPLPHAILPVETPRVLEWTKDHLVVWCRIQFFQVDASPRIALPQGVVG